MEIEECSPGIPNRLVMPIPNDDAVIAVDKLDLPDRVSPLPPPLNSLDV